MSKLRTVKKTMWEENPYCVYCEIKLSLGSATIEHLKPIILGGTDDPENLAIACSPCNWIRGQQTRRDIDGLPSLSEGKLGWLLTKMYCKEKVND